MTTAISCEGLTRAFPSGVAVDNVSFELPEGSVLALLGQNGAGKTTTIRLLNGVLAQDSGNATVLGLDPQTDGLLLRQQTGVLTENAGLDDRLTARENLQVVAAMRKIPAAVAAPRIDDLLERFDIVRLRDQRCQGFSTGQRRRLALARAMLSKPRLLYLDEPTSGLDPSGTKAVMHLIETLARDQGCTVVLCTHFLGDAGSSADWMAVMHFGRLELFGRPEAIAAQWWPGYTMRVDLGRSATAEEVAVVQNFRATTSAATDPVGIEVVLEDRAAAPHLLRYLVDNNIAAFGANHLPRGLEEIYFATQRGLGIPDSRLVADLGEAP